jgi:uncharacterized repeat protein (TIGR01451 family)
MKRRMTERTTLRPGSSWLLTVLFSALSFFSANSQGWEISFGGTGEDQGQAIIQTIDRGFVLVGFSESYGADNDLDVFVVRTDVDGKLLWSNVYDEGFIEHGYDVIETQDQGLLIVGDIFNTLSDFPGNANVYLIRLDKYGRQLWSRQYETDHFSQGLSICKATDGGYAILGRTKNTSTGRDDVLLVRIDENGNQLWSKNYGGPADDRGTSIVALPDGFAFTGFSAKQTGIGNDILLYRVDASGEIVWNQIFSTAGNAEGHDIIRTLDGKLVLTGNINNYNDAFVAKYNTNGSLIWTKSIGISNFGDEAYGITQLRDSSYVITGRTETSPSNTDMLLAKLDKEGNTLWARALGNAGRLDTGEDLVATSEGNLAVIGYNALDVVFFNDLTLFVTDANGNIITNSIHGKVFRDQGSCQYDNLDTPLNGWLVKAQAGNRIYYGVSDTDGNYSIAVDTGIYQITIIPRIQDYWQSCVPGGYIANLSNSYDTARLDFPLFPLIDCPFLEVNVTAPYIQYCSDVSYTVNYQNIGPGNGNDAYIDIRLDSTLTFINADIPAQINGQQLRFNLGNVAGTSQGTFNFRVSVPCTGFLLGAAALVQAEIFPNTPCTSPNPDWDGSSIRVSGQCEGDSIRFTIENAGNGGMNDPGNYIIIEDQILLLQEEFQLDAGSFQQKTLPAGGATYRLVAEQSALHPGRNYPTVAVEGCSANGSFSTGTYTQFPENDQDPFIDIDVQEIVGSTVLPADLRGHPKGYGDEARIAQNTDITYTIVFNNTGTDTITRIVIRDTLSALLDPASVIPGSSSHPFRWEVYGNGILRFTFDNVLLLPAGSAADQDSRGFINFKVSQKPNLNPGLTIENRAAIFFDYEAPAFSPTVRHKVGQFPQFITVSTDEPTLMPGVIINVFPNPFTEVANFDIRGTEGKTATLTIVDALGTILAQETFSGNQLAYKHKTQWPSGIYYYLLHVEGKLAGTGKIMVR